MSPELRKVAKQITGQNETLKSLKGFEEISRGLMILIT